VLVRLSKGEGTDQRTGKRRKEDCDQAEEDVSAGHFEKCIVVVDRW
jgi:hypothetical protein